MTPQEIIDIISKYSLTVRCLPRIFVNYEDYREGDENRAWVNHEDIQAEAKREVVIQDLNLEFFQKTELFEWCTPLTPEQRYSEWKRMYPKGRKLLKDTIEVEKGDRWYVKETPNIDSAVRFNRGYDEYFAPTLEEAIQLFLKGRSSMKLSAY